MKTIYVDVLVELQVTDDEYNNLKSLAKDPDPRADGIYNDIFVPSWVEDKIRETVNIVPDSGTISGSSWVNISHEGGIYDEETI